MNKQDKIFDAIGKLDADTLAGALAYSKKTIERKSFSIGKIAAIALAATMCLTLVVSVAAYGDEMWSAIFERQKTLIDDKTVHINETSGNESIEVSVDDVIITAEYMDDDYFFGEFYVTFKNLDGLFENGINYKSYTIETLIDGEWKIDQKWDRDDNENYDGETYTGDCTIHTPDGIDIRLAGINYGLDEQSDTISVGYKMFVMQYGKKRLTYKDVTSYDGSIVYADTISIEFSVEKEETQSIQQLNDYKSQNNKFMIEGCEFEILGIKMFPRFLEIEMCQPDSSIITVEGKEYYAINYLLDFYFTMDYYDAYNAWDGALEQARITGVPLTDDELSAYEMNMIMAQLRPVDEEVLKHGYKVKAELKPECGAQVENDGVASIGSSRGVDGNGNNTQCVRADFNFTSPIYVSDIVRIYLEKCDDPSTQIDIWTPENDPGLVDIK